jgi:ribosomal protein S18 acetylase RimI-like enzyme
MNIRKVELEEIKDVLALIDEYDRPGSPWPGEQEIISIYSAITESGGSVIGAFENNELVGTCTLNVCPNLSWSGRSYAIIENVIVSKQHRNQGIGKAILSYAKKQAQKIGCYKIALMTDSKKEATLKFYRSAGFTADKIGYQSRFNA